MMPVASKTSWWYTMLKTVNHHIKLCVCQDPSLGFLSSRQSYTLILGLQLLFFYSYFYNLPVCIVFVFFCIVVVSYDCTVLADTSLIHFAHCKLHFKIILQLHTSCIASVKSLWCITCVSCFCVIFFLTYWFLQSFKTPLYMLSHWLKDSFVNLNVKLSFCMLASAK